MTGNWNFHQCNVNDKLAFIFLDLSLKRVAPDRQRPIILVVWVYLLQPNPENGLSTDAEFDALSSIEDQLSESLVKEFSATYAGRITNDGRREFYFYSSSSADFEAKAQAAMSKFSDYKIEAWAQPDPEWNQYLNLLYPSKTSLRWITDSSVIEALASQGDSPEVARQITHFSYFKNTNNRAAFVTAFENNGFKCIELTQKEESESGFGYGVKYEMTQIATLPAVYETTGRMEELSEMHDGIYDGWECPVTRAKSKSWWRFGK